MKLITRIFQAIHALMACLFACGALMLVVIAARMGWLAFAGGLDGAAAQQIIEAVGLLAAAVVALQIAETIAEEEVVRDADISAPTRVRRFLSRFMVVVVVALAFEGLVATGFLLAAWGVFVHLNRSAEELEPEAMEDAKREDKKLK